MVLHLLDKFLPIELTDKIYKELHRSLMDDICETINFKTVFIMVYDTEHSKSKMSWISCENQNYYKLLNDEIVLNN
mgnify:CR=1 FL=1|jgi:hypothetical protein